MLTLIRFGRFENGSPDHYIRLHGDRPEKGSVGRLLDDYQETTFARPGDKTS